MTMHSLNIWKGGEVLIENDETGDVLECFYHLEARDVYIEDAEGNRLFELTVDNVTFESKDQVLEVPKDFRAHETVWRFIVFGIDLVDKEHILSPKDFTWHWAHIGDYSFPAFDIKESVGELLFEYASDGICDEDLELDNEQEEKEEDSVAS